MGMESPIPEPDPKLTPPKLQLYSSGEKPDPPGMETPPIGPRRAVPFRWEEAPGKPKNATTTTGDNKNYVYATATRRLGLPPRLVLSTEKSNNKRGQRVSTSTAGGSSSSAQLKSYDRRSVSLPSLSSLVVKGKKYGDILSPSYYSSSSSSPSNSNSPSSSSCSPIITSLASPFSNYFNGTGNGGESEEDREKEEVKMTETKVRIRRYSRSKIHSCVGYPTTSDLWAKISGRLQAAVPWKRDSKM